MDYSANLTLPSGDTNKDIESVRDLLFGNPSANNLNRVAQASPIEISESPFESVDSEEIKQLNSKIQSLETQLHRFEAQVWSEFHSKSQKQSDDISGLKQELMNRIDHAFSALANQSADGTELGTFLIDLGMKIQKRQPNNSAAHN